MRRRFASFRKHWVAIVLVIFTPLITGAISMSTVAEPTQNPTGQPQLPAAIVNNDELVYEKIGGKKTPVAAGRLLVGELVTNPSDGFDWTITDDAVAKKGLETGEYVAVVTIPQNFSAAYISSTGDNPQQATLTVETDGSHSYVAAVLALALSHDLTTGISSQLTQGFIENLLLGYTKLDEGLAEVAKGSTELTVGLEELSKATQSLPTLTRELASGARLLDEGVNDFAKDLLVLIALSTETASKTVSVAEQSAALTQYVLDLPDFPQEAGILERLAVLDLTADEAALKAEETKIGAVLAEAFAKELRKGSSALATGTRELAAGMPALHEGIKGAATGSKGLTKALDKIVKDLPKYTEDQAAELSTVVTTPVVTETITEPKLPKALSAVGAIVIPISLWIGALAISFIRPAFSQRALGTRAGNGRIVLQGAIPAVSIAIAQGALILIGLYLFRLEPVYHFMLMAVVAASVIAFSLLHQGLLALTGRFAWLISLALLSAQIFAAGVVLPMEFVAQWMLDLGKVLPLSESIIAMQEVVTGGQQRHVTAAILWILGSAVVGIILSLIAVARGRRVRSA